MGTWHGRLICTMICTLACLLLAVGAARGEAALRLGVLAGAPLPVSLPADAAVELIPVAADALPEGLDGVLLFADAPLFRMLRDQGALRPVGDLPLYPGIASSLTRGEAMIALPLHARISMLLTRLPSHGETAVSPVDFLTQAEGLGDVPSAAWSGWGRALYVQAASGAAEGRAWTDALRTMADLPSSTGEGAAFQFGSPFHRTVSQRGWQPVYPVLPGAEPSLPVTLFVGAALSGGERPEETLAFLHQLMTRSDGETQAYTRPDAAPVDMPEYTRWMADTQAYLETLEACAGAGEMCMRMDEFAAQQAEMAPYRYLIAPAALNHLRQRGDLLSAGMAGLPYDPDNAPLEYLLLRWTWGQATAADVLDALSALK